MGRDHGQPSDEEGAMNQSNQPNPFIQFIADYRNHPTKFVEEILGIKPDPWQSDLLEAIARGERKISVRSGHGVGKTATTSWAMIWFILTRYPVKVIVTAPTSAQLFDALFAELKRWIKELPPGLNGLLEPKQDRIELRASPTEAFISARTSRAEQPEALAGVHADHVLLIADEASGVPEAVFEAAAGSMSGHNATTILLGNPTRSVGYFYETHHRLKSEWWTRKVSCLDSPRVSDAYVSEMKSRYGEESNAFRIRVLGEFPRSDDDTVIPVELVESAQNRDTRASPTAQTIWGLDVARFGTDKSALCKRQSNVVHEIRKWAGLDLMQLTGAVVAEYESSPSNARPTVIMVDSIGLGAGVVDRLKELGLPARGINVSESPALGATYVNLRAELWFRAKQWLEARDCRIPKDEQLFAELVGPRFSFASNGKMKVEGKDEMRRRGLGSPDAADAFCLTFAGSAATALYGRQDGQNWSKPVLRRIPGIV
jgi:phage terminase large subunit